MIADRKRVHIFLIALVAAGIAQLAFGKLF